MASKFYIPNKVTIGFSSEDKTSSGKLAQITYKDARGNIAREKTWRQSIHDADKPTKVFVNYEKFADGKINYNKPVYRTIEGFPIVELDNTPTRGFILNKLKDNNNITWENKPSSCYFYDPRGFEIPINLNNLLYILSLTNGDYNNTEFVYSWIDDVLILLPCNSQEYQNSIEFQDVKSMKFSLKDLKPGCIYHTKRLSKVVYMGRFDIVETDHYVNSYVGYRRFLTHKSHMFAVTENGKTNFIPLTSSALAKMESNKVVKNFSELSNQLESSGKILSAEVDILPVTIADMLQKERDTDDKRVSNFVNNSTKDQFIAYVSQPKGNNKYEVFKLFQSRTYYNRRNSDSSIKNEFEIIGYKLKPSYQEYIIDNNKISVKSTKTIKDIHDICYDRTGAYTINTITEQQANQLNLVKVKLKFKNSKAISI